MTPAATVTEVTGYEIERDLAAAGARCHLKKHRPDIEGQLSLL